MPGVHSLPVPVAAAGAGVAVGMAGTMGVPGVPGLSGGSGCCDVGPDITETFENRGRVVV